MDWWPEYTLQVTHTDKRSLLKTCNVITCNKMNIYPVCDRAFAEKPGSQKHRVVFYNNQVQTCVIVAFKSLRERTDSHTAGDLQPVLFRRRPAADSGLAKFKIYERRI